MIQSGERCGRNPWQRLAGQIRIKGLPRYELRSGGRNRRSTDSAALMLWARCGGARFTSRSSRFRRRSARAQRTSSRIVSSSSGCSRGMQSSRRSVLFMPEAGTGTTVRLKCPNVRLIPGSHEAARQEPPHPATRPPCRCFGTCPERKRSRFAPREFWPLGCATSIQYTLRRSDCPIEFQNAEPKA